ncbi:hypothetical protein AUR64_08930 [Haloprofundus marisrubri]|uniref:DICT domain-containing protein n=1 Tax=Haloprofundus marisrubri TaxID=1514971 RepID=A0A0W1R8L1_9EURY|nr:DICT sensory domain-containing protein [Haloprofundus marisrubri]KTG09750.1 hypothetical protein AUR64_08930 [Haloprofundus marisrubri]
MLAEAIDSVDSQPKTLAVFNYGGPEELRRRLESYFELHNVAVEYGRTDPDDPDNYVLLYDDSGVVAAASVGDLEGELLVGSEYDAEETAVALTDRAYPRVLRWLDDTLFVVGEQQRRILVEVSRYVETLAARGGGGTIRSGFQNLSRLTDDEATVSTYRRIVDAGVETHVYGIPDETARLDELDEFLTIHPGDTGELARTWFVVYDGGDDGETAALVAEERGEGYHGFWTFDAEAVRTLDQYLADNYL